MTEGEDAELMSAALVVVFDTNVLIPLILPASRSTTIFFRLVDNGHRVVVSPPIIAEAREKMFTKRTLRRWLEASDERINRFLDDLEKTCEIAVIPKDVPRYVEDDPDDDPVIATALQCDAGYIISEDRHLLRLDGFQGIRIMTREAFLSELDLLGVP